MKLHIAFGVSAVVAATACDSIPTEILEVESPLPPQEALAIPKPSDAASTTGQALCAEGNETITSLEARIDELNADIADDVAVIEALYEAAPDNETGIVVYEAESDGVTLRVQLVVAGGRVAITGTRDGADFISGAYDSDGLTGAIVLQTAAGPVNSAWTTAEGKTQIARTIDDLSVAVVIDESKVSLAITDGAEAVAAVWDRDTREGAFAAEGDPGCWSGAASSADMCDVVCSDDVVADLPTP